MAEPTTTTNKVQIGGKEVCLHTWNVQPESEKPPKAIVVIFHGFGAHGKYPTVRYAAELLASSDYAVLAPDMPGHGQSEGLRGYVESADSWIETGIAVVEHARQLYESHANLKVFVLGSSMGGTISLSVAHALESQAVSGVMLLAPMLKLNVSSVEQYALKGLAMLLPTVPLIPSSATSSEKQYRDPDKRKECDDDQFTVGGKLRVGSALSCIELAEMIKSKFESVSVPFIILLAEEDVVVNNEGSEELFEKATSEDKTMKRYRALHGILCEPAPLVNQIQDDMMNWINSRC